MRRTLFAIAAVAMGLMPLPPRLVERVYTGGFYSAIQPLITGVSNRVSVALFDLLLVVVVGIVAGLAARAVRARRQGWLRAIWDVALSLAATSAVFYLAFLALWGWNYRRVPLARKLQYDAARVTGAAVAGAAHDAALELNRLYTPAHHAGWTAIESIDPPLADAFADTQRLLGAARLAVPARPKLTLLDPYFRRVGISGMTDPYFLETLVDGTLLPYERPFVVAHEWAHLAGYADEGEANFVGWLTCARADEPARYSGWLFLYEEFAGLETGPDRARLDAALAGGVRADLRAIEMRLRRNISPALARAGWRAYDRYLKANRVPEGAASYETVVRLVLGVRFGPDWTPRLRHGDTEPQP